MNALDSIYITSSHIKSSDKSSLCLYGKSKDGSTNLDLANPNHLGKISYASIEGEHHLPYAYSYFEDKSVNKMYISHHSYSIDMFDAADKMANDYRNASRVSGTGQEILDSSKALTSFDYSHYSKRRNVTVRTNKKWRDADSMCSRSYMWWYRGHYGQSYVRIRAAIPRGSRDGCFVHSGSWCNYNGLKFNPNGSGSAILTRKEPVYQRYSNKHQFTKKLMQNGFPLWEQPIKL